MRWDELSDANAPSVDVVELLIHLFQFPVLVLCGGGGGGFEVGMFVDLVLLVVKLNVFIDWTGNTTDYRQLRLLRPRGLVLLSLASVSPHRIQSTCQIKNTTRKAWPRQACSPRGIAALPPRNRSETKHSTDRPTKLSTDHHGA